MNRIIDGFLLVTVCAGMIVFVAFHRASAAELQSTPNFLLIFVDDQSWSGTSIAMMPNNDLSRSPGFQMPNLERIASQGMIFSQAYASHPKCECSRAALLMGRSTTSLNAVDKTARNWNAPPTDSLANTLKRANGSYRAAHYGKWQWPQTPESLGYDDSDGITMNEDGDTSDPNDPKQSFGITRRAQAYMGKQVKDGHPFYLQLSYYATHNQPQALASTLKKYENKLPSSGGKGGRGGGAVMAAMTEDLDTCIGVLAKQLEELGISKNTYVIYMSDNGGGTQVLKGGKALVDEGGLRVPLIVNGPGIKGGTYCNDPAVGYDILATVLDFAAPGFALPKGVEGGSWKPVLMNSGIGNIQRPIDRLVFHHDVEIPHPQTAMRKGDLKIVHYWDTKESFLYDLSNDLGERNNLAAEKPNVVIDMLSELKAHVKNGLDTLRFASLESGQFRGNDRPKGSGGKGKDGKGKMKGPGGAK
jgi:arylsulfatase A-like enzyme